MRSLRDDGFRQLRSGRTTVQEILRVTKDEVFDLDGLLGFEAPKPEANGAENGKLEVGSRKFEV